MDWPPEGRLRLMKDFIEPFCFTLGAGTSLRDRGVEQAKEGCLIMSGTSVCKFHAPNFQSILKLCFFTIPIMYLY